MVTRSVSRWYGVVPTAAPGVASEEAAEGQAPTAQDPVVAKSGSREFRARRRKTARLWKRRREDQLIEPDDCNEGLAGPRSGCKPVCHDVTRRFKRPIPVSRIAFRGISVRSVSATSRTAAPGGSLACACRKTSRRIRLVRVRTVAFPARRPMARSNSLPVPPGMSRYPTNGCLTTRILLLCWRAPFVVLSILLKP